MIVKTYAKFSFQMKESENIMERKFLLKRRLNQIMWKWDPVECFIIQIYICLIILFLILEQETCSILFFC